MPSKVALVIVRPIMFTVLFVTATNVLGPDTRVDGFWIQDGKADCFDQACRDQDDMGGGILITGNSHPLIVRCTFWHNKARTGGGIYFNPEQPATQHLEIINCEFDDCAIAWVLHV